MNNIEIYLLPVSVMVFVLLLFVGYLLWQSKKELESKNILIEKQEEKINWLREIAAENEHRHTNKDHETQKKIMELEHTVEILYTQAKEGTKNQVVSKIEALQAKRARALERTDLAL